MSDLATAKYVRLTTFTNDGRPKHTPVWIAALEDGNVATTTDDDSWKVKRIRRKSDVELAASDGKGAVEESTETIRAMARIVDCADSEYLQIERAFLSKYGLMYRLFRFIRKLRGKTACGVTMTLVPDSPRDPGDA